MSSFIRSNRVLVAATILLCLSLGAMLAIYFTGQLVHFGIEVDIGVGIMVALTIAFGGCVTQLIRKIRKPVVVVAPPPQPTPKPVEAPKPQPVINVDDERIDALVHPQT